METLDSFLKGAEQLLASIREEEERQLEERRQEIRRKWDEALAQVREQLPEVLHPYLVVDEKYLEKEPCTGNSRWRGMDLKIPGCSPIELSFKSYTWDISEFCVRIPTSVEECEGTYWLSSHYGPSAVNPQLAVAYAQEFGPEWAEMGAEVEWRNRGRDQKVVIDNESDLGLGET